MEKWLELDLWINRDAVGIILDLVIDDQKQSHRSRGITQYPSPTRWETCSTSRCAHDRGVFSPRLVSERYTGQDAGFWSN